MASTKKTFLERIKYSGTIEKYWPLTLTILLSLLFVKLSFNHYHIGNAVNEMIDRSLNVSGTLIGFFLTIFTILSTIKTRRMQFIKEAGLYPRVNRYLIGVIIWHLINISFILFAPIVAKFIHEWYAVKIIQGVMVFTLLFSWSLSIRFVSIFVRLLSDP